MPVWIGLIARLRFEFHISFFFLAHMNSNRTVHAHWFTVQETKCTIYALFTHCSWDPQSLYSEKKIKNGSHGTIHTFKNYFTTVFSILSNINCIYMDPKSLVWNRIFVHHVAYKPHHHKLIKWPQIGMWARGAHMHPTNIWQHLVWEIEKETNTSTCQPYHINIIRGAPLRESFI